MQNHVAARKREGILRKGGAKEFVTVNMLYDVAVHLLGATAFELLKAFALGVLLIQLRRLNWNRSASIVFLATFSVVALAFLLFSAAHYHQKAGYVNGEIFAADCAFSLVPLAVLVYLLVRNSLSFGLKRQDWAKSPSLWGTHGAPGSRVAVASSSQSLQFRAQFTGDGDRWANMDIRFPEVQDFLGWAGISFDIRCSNVYPESTITLQVGMTNGSTYTSCKPVQLSKQRAVFLFQEMQWGSWSQQSPHGCLELKNIICVAVGCNTTQDDVSYCVDNFALERFSDINKITGGRL